MAAPTNPQLRSRARRGPLTIAAIDVTPIVVPLDQEYRGSYYRMKNRATVLTRVVTNEGIVGEAYAGDEDSTLGDIVGVVMNEIAPRLIGAERASRSSAAGSSGSRSPTTSCATGGSASSLSRASTSPSGTRSARPLGRPLWQLWGGYRDAIAVNIIGGYYGRDLDGIRDEVDRVARDGLPRLQVQDRRHGAARGRGARRGRARGCRRRLRDHDRRQPGLHARAGDRPLPPRPRPRHPLVRGALHLGATTHATCATSARPAESRSAPGRASTRRRAAAT